MILKKTKCEMNKMFCTYIFIKKEEYYEKEIQKWNSLKFDTRYKKEDLKTYIKQANDSIKNSKEIQKEVTKNMYINLYNNPKELYKIKDLYSNFRYLEENNYIIYDIEPLSLIEKGDYSNRKLETNDFKILNIIDTKEKLYNSLKEKGELKDYLVYLYKNYQYGNDGYKEKLFEEMNYINDNYNENKLSIRDIYETSLYNDQHWGNKNHKELDRFCNIGEIEKNNLRNLLDLGLLKHIKDDYEYLYVVETLFGLLEKGFNCVATEYLSKLFNNLDDEKKKESIASIKKDEEIISYIKLNIDNEDIKIMAELINVDKEHKRLIVKRYGKYDYDFNEEDNRIIENIVFLTDDEIKTYLIKNYSFTFESIKNNYEKIKNCGLSENDYYFKVEL